MAGTVRKGDDYIMQEASEQGNEIRVLHINNNYTGTTLHQNMLEHLNKCNVVSCVFVPTSNAKASVIKANDNVYVSECIKRWHRIFFYYKQSKIISALTKKIDVSKYDCIHAYTLFTDGNCAFELSKKYLKPFVVAVRNTDVNAFFKWRPYLREKGLKIMEAASAIFFLSEAYRKIVFAKYVPMDMKEKLYKKTYVIPNGVDEFWINNKSYSVTDDDIKRINGKKLRIIYAGRVDRNKNISLTQKAIELLVSKGYEIEFTVVGKIENAVEAKRIISNKRTTYMEALPKEQLCQVYRKNDIFIMPSIYESFGLVYAEAMSQGLPVIYTRGQGFDGNFDEGVVGFSTPSDDAVVIADGIEKICDNYRAISLNCVQLCKRFSWSDIVKLYSQVYLNVIYRQGMI